MTMNTMRKAIGDPSLPKDPRTPTKPSRQLCLLRLDGRSHCGRYVKLIDEEGAFFLNFTQAVSFLHDSLLVKSCVVREREGWVRECALRGCLISCDG